MGGLLFLLAVCGAFVDWRYVSRGGVTASASEKRTLVLATMLCLVGLIAFGGLGASADWLGETTALLMSIVAVLWGFRRWRVRCANPLAKTT